MRCVVTGCAGFIGSHLTDRLLAEGHQVAGIDNFSTGQRRFLAGALAHPAFTLHQVDLLEPDALTAAFEGAERVYHFAANADVRRGFDHPRRDLEQNTLATSNVLEAARKGGARQLVFASTGSVYGDATVVPTPEDAPFPLQTSLYGASKVACEGLISAYTEASGLQAFIFRFVSVLGARYTHGHVFDFYRALKADPTRLHVLGNGRQRKSYMDVEDCLDGIALALARAAGRCNVFNLGVDGVCEVNDSVAWISEAMGCRPVLTYGGGERGWVGDSPLIHLDTSRIRALGWQPRIGIREGVLRTVSYLRENEWVFDARGV